MNKLLPGFLLLTTLPLLLGCPGRPTVNSAKPAVAAQQQDPLVAATRMGSELLRQANEPAQFRDGLQILNPVFEQPDMLAKVQLSAEQRQYLKDKAHLSDAELNEVEAATFRPADAYALEEATLLRDAARGLEVNGLSTAELTRVATRWVARNVLLHEQGDDWLPVGFVLKCGYGSPRARAFALLALLRQAQVNGCVLVVPGSEAFLVGIVDADGKAVHLVDPRLGTALAKPDGTVATLADVQQNPKLLETQGITPDQVKTLEARLVCPLTSLAPRIRSLEEILSKQDRINLAIDLKALETTVAQATGLPTKVWNSEAPDAESPLRALRRFLPVDEGGIDKAPPGRSRLERFQARQLPGSTIGVGLDQLRLTSDLAGPARFVLLRLIETLFLRYDQQPHEALLRGQYEQALSRLDRIRGFVEDDLPVGEDPQFLQEVARWRARVNDAYLAAGASKDARAQSAVQRVWSENAYINALAGDTEESPDRFKKLEQEAAKNPGEDKQPERRAQPLTLILEFVCREPLLQRSNWVVACSWQEKAERAQVVAQLAAGENPRAVKSAQDAWVNTRGAWTSYLSRLSFTSNALRQRLGPVQQRLNGGDIENAVGLLETLHLDLHRYYTARLYRAEASARVDGWEPERADVQNAIHELDALLTATAAKEGPVSLKAVVDAMTKIVPNIADPVARQILHQRLALLSHDWTERGHVAALRQRYQQALDGGR